MNFCVNTPASKKRSLFDEIVTRVLVFARVTPKQKEEVITTLKSQGKKLVVTSTNCSPRIFQTKFQPLDNDV